jgi:hypothetical protein
MGKTMNPICAKKYADNGRIYKALTRSAGTQRNRQAPIPVGERDRSVKCDIEVGHLN